MSTDLATRIRRLIRASGPIPVSDYIATCLFDPQGGYYATHEPFGAEGECCDGRDDDGDGYGGTTITYDACLAPRGYVSDATDCDLGTSHSPPDASPWL